MAYQDEKVTNANMKINDILEDGPSNLGASLDTEQMSRAEEANHKINEGFNDDGARANDIPPTYLYNNTPAIKINVEKE